MEVDVGLGTVISVSPKSLPCWVAVAARTSEGMGPFSNFKKVRWGLWSAGQNIRVNGSLE